MYGRSGWISTPQDYDACVVQLFAYGTSIRLKTAGGSNFRYTPEGADKSLARPGRKQATATEDFDVHTHISNLLS